MATITDAGETWTTTAGAKTVTATPAVNDLIVIICANSGRTVTQAPTVTDNNSSGTYTQVKANTKNSSADSMWVFIRNALITSASSTIFTFTPAATDTGGGLWVARVSGMTRLAGSAVKQMGGQDNVASGTPAVTLDLPVLTGNAIVGGVFTGSNSSANSAPPTSWTEGMDLGYNSPPSGLATEFRSSGETGTTITFGASAPSAFCSVVVELDTSTISALTPRPKLIPQLLSH